MRAIEEPFLTRDAVLSVLRPGELTSERPFRTLRERGAASEGFAIPIRTPSGQVFGRIQLYSSLNADAARAYRLRRIEVARELAGRAAIIERSPAATLVREAVTSAAASLPVDHLSAETPPSLRRYVNARAHSTWRGLDREGLVREWLSHSDAWLATGSDGRDALIDAAIKLDQQACQAREDVLGEDAASATTFYGVVRRMDVAAAEIEGVNGQTLLVPRDDLDRQGLAVLGQPVAVLREVLPGGGSYSLPMPAIAVDEEGAFADVRPSWDSGFDQVEDGSVWGVSALRGRDVDWLERELAREPNALLAAPLPIA
jgi:hypothetical protein